MHALLLSPHLDDAAFSCGGTAARLAAAGWDVTLSTLYTATVRDPAGFALECQTSKGILPEVDYMALRRGEDAAAAIRLGCSAVRWRPLREAPHRGYHTAAALFQPPHPEDDPQPIAAEVRAEIDRARPDVVFTPQSWGRHVDHVHVSRALLDFALPAVAWWEDLPYMLRDDPQPPPDDIADRLPRSVLVVDVDATLAKKLDACAAYTSQLGFQFGGVSEMRRRLSCPRERLLVTPTAADLLRSALSDR